ncbi:hypothetical protein [Clostridium butyricum]|uniref:hypothetical protein n=1 Tax=Clostridium butyricum TaxID=1492 RepID=UPI0032C19535
MTRHYPEDNIFRSKDGGETWKSLWTISDDYVRTDSYTIDYTAVPWLDWGIKKAPDDVERSPKLGWMLGDIKIDPFNSDHVLYGTGATNITITGDPRVYGRVYVGTNGRGIVYADLKEENR